MEVLAYWIEDKVFKLHDYFETTFELKLYEAPIIIFLKDVFKVYILFLC